MIAPQPQEPTHEHADRAPTAPPGRAVARAPASPARSAIRAAPRAADPLGVTLAAAVLARANGKTKSKAKQGKAKHLKAKGGIKKPSHTKPKPSTAAVAVAAALGTRPTRTRRAPGEIDRQIHWGPAQFGAFTTMRGGTSVRVDLGPAAGQRVNYGSVPRLGSCTAVEWLNANGYGGHAWIKGHLLNDNLGGEGLSKNLTPMTHTANMGYKAFESSIKNAIDVCYREGQFNYVDRWYGVRVAIDVIGQEWPGAADAEVRAVADHVSTTADYIEKVGAAAPVVIARPAWAPVLVTGDYDCVV